MSDTVVSLKNNTRLYALALIAVVLAVSLFGLHSYTKMGQVFFLVKLGKAYLEDSDAQLVLGRLYLGWQGFAKDEKKALRWTERSVRNGNEEAFKMLILLYQQGEHIPKDEKKAVEWLEYGANKNMSWAAHNAGWAYQMGLGVEKDCKTAEKYYKQAYDLGSSTSAANILFLYHGDDCNFDDDKERFKWAKILVEQGDARAYPLVGIYYVEGMGVQKDEAEGMRWFKKSAELKDPIGMYNLSRAYVAGTNNEKDLDAAADLAMASYSAGQEEALDMVLAIANAYLREDPPQKEKAYQLMMFATWNRHSSTPPSWEHDQ